MTASHINEPGKQARYGLALVVAMVVFFMVGLVTVLKDLLVPHLKSIFDLSYTQSMLVQFMFFSAYLVMSVPSAKAISTFGYQGGIALGLGVIGLGGLLFIPAATMASFNVFLLALLVMASGVTLLQVAINPFTAALGSKESSSSRLNLAQALNSLGTTIGPYLGGILILSSAAVAPEVVRTYSAPQLEAYRTTLAATVKLPFFVITVTCFVLALIVWRLSLPKLSIETRGTDEPPLRTVFQYRHCVLGAVGIFAYVGAEVAIGGVLYNYLANPAIGNMTERAASGYVSFYWMGAMIGRFVGAAALTKVRPGRALASVALAACVLVLTSMFSTGLVAMWTLLAVGLFNAIMFPTIFALGIADLGKLTGKGSALINMAIVGGAIVPVVFGAVADSVGLQKALIVTAICYLYIAYFGISGHKVRKAYQG
jgi:FHS family L-fucose permease-like MFS transporter